MAKVPTVRKIPKTLSHKDKTYTQYTSTHVRKIADETKKTLNDKAQSQYAEDAVVKVYMFKKKKVYVIFVRDADPPKPKPTAKAEAQE